MRTRPYIVVPSVKSAKYRVSTHSYPNNAFLEAERIANESQQIVRVYRREGKERVLHTVFNPKAQLELLLRRRARLERELILLEQEIEHMQRQQGESHHGGVCEKNDEGTPA